MQSGSFAIGVATRDAPLDGILSQDKVSRARPAVVAPRRAPPRAAPRLPSVSLFARPCSPRTAPFPPTSPAVWPERPPQPACRLALSLCSPRPRPPTCARSTDVSRRGRRQRRGRSRTACRASASAPATSSAARSTRGTTRCRSTFTARGRLCTKSRGYGAKCCLRSASATARCSRPTLGGRSTTRRARRRALLPPRPLAPSRTLPSRTPSSPPPTLRLVAATASTAEPRRARTRQPRQPRPHAGGAPRAAPPRPQAMPAGFQGIIKSLSML